MHVNRLTLQWHKQFYIELQDKELLKKYPVNDCIQMLTDVKKIKINDNRYLNKITAHSFKMAEKLDLSFE